MQRPPPGGKRRVDEQLAPHVCFLVALRRLCERTPTWKSGRRPGRAVPP